MNKYNQPINSATEWKSFYKGLGTETNIPECPKLAIDRNNAYFNEPYLDLSEVKEKLIGSSVKMIVLYCDILQIPDGFKWTLDGKVLMIVARQVYWGKRATINLDFRANKSGGFIFFKDQINGKPNIISVSANNTATIHQLELKKGEGYLLKQSNDKVKERNVSIRDGIADRTEENFNFYLNNAFIYASILFDLNKELAASINQWVSLWSLNSKELQYLFYRSSAMHALLSAQISAQSQNASFVPRLSRKIYEGLANTFVTATAEYQDNYNQFESLKELTAQNIALSTTLRDNKQYETEYFDKLLDQAKENLKQALKTKAVAQYAFNIEQRKTDLLKIDFVEYGIPEFIRGQILKAVFKLIMMIATIVAAIASMGAALGGATKGLKGAGDAAGAVNDANSMEELSSEWEDESSEIVLYSEDIEEDIEELRALGDEVRKDISKLADSLKMLKDTIEALKKIVEASLQIYKQSLSLYKSSKENPLNQKLSDLQKDILERKTTTLSVNEVWDVFLLEFDKSMEAATSADEGKGIQYSKEYVTQVHVLAIYGKSLANAQQAVIEASNHISSLLLQKALAKRQEKRLEEYVNQLEHKEVNYVKMKQIFYHRMLDMKGNLLSALHNYKSAYKYWALQSSSVNPTMLNNAQEIGTGINQLIQTKIDEEHALKSFNPAPAPFTRKEYHITDTVILDRLRKTNATNWSIPSDVKIFKGLDRVRVQNIEIWLEGVKNNGSNPVLTIKIINSGIYEDRFRRKDFRFKIEPLIETFQYKMYNKTASILEKPDRWLDNNQTKAYIESYAQIVDELKYAYTMPTPFTDWTIELPPEYNEGVDLSEIKGITMVFEGSAI